MNLPYSGLRKQLLYPMVSQTYITEAMTGFKLCYVIYNFYLINTTINDLLKKQYFFNRTSIFNGIFSTEATF